MLVNGYVGNGIANNIIVGVDNSIGMNLYASTCTNIGVLIDDVATKGTGPRYNIIPVYT